MKILAVNGSPRKKWNTATLLEKTIEGAQTMGAETDLIHLYDLNYKGCKSCFACKTIGSKSYGRCAVRDDLSPIQDVFEDYDGLVLGSPIYFSTVTGEMRSFLERLMFPYSTYTTPQSLFPKQIRSAFIYTMNVSESRAGDLGYYEHLGHNKRYLEMIFGPSESLYCYETYQFEDYSKVVADNVDVHRKEQRRREVFPRDCENAFALGVRLAGG